MVMNYKKFSLLFGFSIWLIATLLMRSFGDSILIIENTIVLASLYFGVIPLLFFLIKYVINRFKLCQKAQLKSAVLMAVPGMFCDVLCIKFHAIVFPKFTLDQTITLGSWVLWIYTLVLILGLCLKTKTSKIVGPTRY